MIHEKVVGLTSDISQCNFSLLASLKLLRGVADNASRNIEREIVISAESFTWLFLYFLFDEIHSANSLKVHDAYPVMSQFVHKNIGARQSSVCRMQQ